MIILKQVLIYKMSKFGEYSAGSGLDLVRNSCEHDNEPSIFSEGSSFLDPLDNYQFIRKDSSTLICLMKVRNALFPNISRLLKYWSSVPNRHGSVTRENVISLSRRGSLKV
jgi:hypothetical protein